MSWRDDHAGLMCFACARDRNHSRSSGGGSMCAQNTSDQVRARQVERKEQIVLSQETQKPLSGNGISLFTSVLVQHAG
jgi:hypothetical protein